MGSKKRAEAKAAATADEIEVARRQETIRAAEKLAWANLHNAVNPRLGRPQQVQSAQFAADLFSSLAFMGSGYSSLDVPAPEPEGTDQ